MTSIRTVVAKSDNSYKAAHLGCVRYSRGDFDAAREMLAAGAGASLIARAIGLSRQTILRIKADPVAAEAALTRWGL
ncbi:helix-turn-helix domain-containing protein [Sinorhizobium chiapasense]